jgi:hypothetical protein
MFGKMMMIELSSTKENPCPKDNRIAKQQG